MSRVEFRNIIVSSSVIELGYSKDKSIAWELGQAYTSSCNGKDEVRLPLVAYLTTFKNVSGFHNLARK